VFTNVLLLTYQSRKKTKIKMTHHNRFETIKETEKAVLLRIGAIYCPNAPEIDLPDGGKLTATYADIWVPKKCIVDGSIVEWFAMKEIMPKFMYGSNRIMNVIF